MIISFVTAYIRLALFFSVYCYGYVFIPLNVNKYMYIVFRGKSLILVVTMLGYSSFWISCNPDV